MGMCQAQFAHHVQRCFMARSTFFGFKFGRDVIDHADGVPDGIGSLDILAASPESRSFLVDPPDVLLAVAAALNCLVITAFTRADPFTGCFPGCSTAHAILPIQCDEQRPDPSRPVAQGLRYT